MISTTTAGGFFCITSTGTSNCSGMTIDETQVPHTHSASHAEQTSELIAPYGGPLVNLCAPLEERAELLSLASRLSRIQLSERAVCDPELLPTAGFSPPAT